MSVLKIKRGSSAAVAIYTPQAGELLLDTDTNTLTVGNGVTPGGVALANAATAIKLAVARNIAISGAVSGSIAFDGSANVTIVSTLASSIALTGVPTAATAAVDTNTLQLATTAFVVGQAATVAPVMDSVATVGTSLKYARQDHIHPTDTSRAPLASPAFTGTPTAPTAPLSTNTTQLATTAGLRALVLGTVAQTAGTPTGTIFESGSNANGTYVKYADGTMIQRSLVLTPAAATTAAGGIFQGATATTWTFPLVFAVADVVVHACSTAGDTTWVALQGGGNATSAAARVCAPVSTAGAGTLRMIAFGRWF